MVVDWGRCLSFDLSQHKWAWKIFSFFLSEPVQLRRHFTVPLPKSGEKALPAKATFEMAKWDKRWKSWEPWQETKIKILIDRAPRGSYKQDMDQQASVHSVNATTRGFTIQTKKEERKERAKEGMRKIIPGKPVRCLGSGFMLGRVLSWKSSETNTTTTEMMKSAIHASC